jgi:CHASE2 domain-containing sensor protein
MKSIVPPTDKKVLTICSLFALISIIAAFFFHAFFIFACASVGFIIGVLIKNKGYALANKKILAIIACIAVLAMMVSLFMFLYQQPFLWVISVNLVCFTAATYLFVKSIRNQKLNEQK